MRHVFEAMECAFKYLTGNLPPPQPGIYPDHHLPRPQGGLPLANARRGMPTPQAFLKGKRTAPI